MTKKPASPYPAEVRAAREQVQEHLGLEITAAQDWCAAAVHTSRRAWQQWETDSGRSHRKMHPALWELFALKLTGLKAETAKDKTR